MTSIWPTLEEFSFISRVLADANSGDSLTLLILTMRAMDSLSSVSVTVALKEYDCFCSKSGGLLKAKMPLSLLRTNDSASAPEILKIKSS